MSTGMAAWMSSATRRHRPCRRPSHDGKLKAILDVIRVVCANAEADLAAQPAPHMTRPREAKKLVTNLLAAPCNVAVTGDAIHIRLAPAANRSERVAIGHLFTSFNARGLSLLMAT